MGHAEPLLLVHHQKAQIPEFHVLLQQTVGADDNIAGSGFQIFQGLFHLRRGPVAVQNLNVDGIPEKSAERRLVMLLGQHRGRRQHGCLLAVQHALHHGTEGYLRFSESHVAAQQTVHGQGFFHIRLDFRNAPELVIGFRVLKALLELRLPLAVRGKGKALCLLPGGIQSGQLLGNVFHGGFRAGFYLGPVRAAHFGQFHGLAVVLTAAHVFADQIQLRSRNIENVRTRVADFDIIFLSTVHFHIHHAGKPADAVVLVDHQIPHLQIRAGADGQGILGVEFFPFGPLFAGFQNLGIRHYGKFGLRVFHTRAQTAGGNRTDPCRTYGAGSGGKHRVDPAALQIFRENMAPALVRSQHGNGIAPVQKLLCILHGRLRAAAVRRQLSGGQADDGFRLHGIPAHGECICHDHGKFPDLPDRLFPRQGEFRNGCHHGAAAHLQLDVIAHLLFVFLCPLRDFSRLIQHQPPVKGQIIQHRGEFPLNPAHIPVRVPNQNAGPELFRVFPERGRQFLGAVGGFLCGMALCLLLQVLRQCHRSALIQAGQGFRRGENHTFLQGVGAALTFRVKQTHGVHVVAPKLAAHRLGIAGGEEIQNAAPAGKLTRTFHLLGALKSAEHQTFFRLFRRQSIAQANAECRLPQLFRGNGPLEQTARRGYHGFRRRVGQHGKEGTQPFLLFLPGNRVRRGKGKLPGGEHGNLFSQKCAQIPGKVLRRRIVRADNQHRAVRLLHQAGGQMGPVNITQAGVQRRQSAAFQQGFQRFSVFLKQILFLLYQFVHHAT